jgi:DNA topoisomerase VI subunit B
LDRDAPEHEAEAQAAAVGVRTMTKLTQAALERATFRTSRLLDFASEKELVAQTGHRREAWPLVVLKELLDNAIDACEEGGIAPEITITVDKTGITVADNGPGIPAETVKGVLDFTVRVSSREAYVSPTRGAQGNALKTVIAMRFVIDGERGAVEIEARGVRHRIEMSVDRIRQEPVIRHEQKESKVMVGTVVRVPWRGLARAQVIDADADLEEEAAEGLDSPFWSTQDAKSRFLQIAVDYAWLNAHTSITLDWFGKRTVVKATDPMWQKWKPSDPTSPHWYGVEHLERLVGAYIKHDSDNGRERTVRELVAEFRGLSATAKQKVVLDATGLARAPLSALVNGSGFDRRKIKGLLGAMKKHSAPVKPELLGSIGKEHLRQRLAAAGCEMESFEYRRVTETEDDVPWIIETAFAWGPKATGRRLITGVNWSPGIVNPFRELGHFGTSLDTILTRAWADTGDPVILVLHIACPRVEYTDRGKSALVMS